MTFTQGFIAFKSAHALRRQRCTRPRALTALVVTVLVAAALSGCASTKTASKSASGNPYYDDNIGDFYTTALTNDIPVIFKQQQGKTAWVGLLIDGGAVLVPQEKSGLEDITLSLMLHGSKNYSYNSILQLQYEKSFSLTASAGKDYAVVALRCIRRDVDDLVPLLGDSVLQPLLTETDFATIMTEERENLQRSLSDPSGVLGLELAKAAYQGHPYTSFASVTQESIDAISLDDVRAHYKTLLNAKRFSFIAVGDFDAKAQKKLVNTLNGLFGTLSATDFARKSIPTLTVASDAPTVYAACDAAADTGYIAGYFACPDRTSSEYVAFAIAAMYLDDIFFAQVREQHGAVYSIGNGVIGGRTMLGVISLYKATEKQELQRYVYEAIDSFPDEEAIAATLDRYKNKYITTLFSASQTVSGVAGNIVSSLAYYGSPSQYLHRSAQVHAVTAKDVADAYSTYLARTPERAKGGVVQPMRWVVVSGEDALRSFTFK